MSHNKDKNIKNNFKLKRKNFNNLNLIIVN